MDRCAPNQGLGTLRSRKHNGPLYNTLQSTNAVQFKRKNELGKPGLKLFALVLKQAITCGPLQAINLRTSVQIQQKDHSHLLPTLVGVGSSTTTTSTSSTTTLPEPPPPHQAPDQHQTSTTGSSSSSSSSSKAPNQ